MHWPCAYNDKHGKCANTLIGHSQKGHQNSKGKVLAAGGFFSDFNLETYEDTWKQDVRDCLIDLTKSLQLETFGAGSSTETDLAVTLHLKIMNRFYDSIGPAQSFKSHSACFCCLRELPVHPLPCQHVLCTKCVKSYGTVMEKFWVSVPKCPLHVAETNWHEPHLVKLKPTNAGVRILVLDGGGVRGIVELEVLRAIEEELGGKLPIQEFFDLIVGTSTGGIIALGLGVAGWSVESCATKFVRLCGKAFTPRDFHGLPFFQQLAFMHHHSLYKTRPFEASLRDVFGSHQMIHPDQTGEGHRTKVAVTSATGTGQSAVVIASYNRCEGLDGNQDYLFERPEHVEDELMIWEAARATSAAPRYFKSFRSSVTRKEYWDGALYHNNPVFVANHERKLLWPDTAGAHPDIMLSIGTGCKSPIKSSTSTKARPLIPRAASEGDAEPSMMRKDWSKRPRWQHLFVVLVKRVQDILDSERIWSTFMMDVELSTWVRRRYQRLNIYLGYEPPELDAVGKVEEMQFRCASKLKNNGDYRTQIRDVAQQLIASSFFFDKSPKPAVECSTGFQVVGKIRCRFLGGSQEVRHLGEYLSSKQVSDFQPYFSVEEYEEHRDTTLPQRITLRENTIQNMRMRAVFNCPAVEIDVSRPGAKTTLLLHLGHGPGAVVSGFPRLLLEDESHDLSRVSSASSTPYNPDSRWAAPPTPRSYSGPDAHRRTTSLPSPSPMREPAASGPTQKAYASLLSLRSQWSSQDGKPDAECARTTSIFSQSFVSVQDSMAEEESDTHSASSAPPRYSVDTGADDKFQIEMRKALEASLMEK